MNTCLKCGFETSNPKFCGRSCAASYNNSIVPRRRPEHKCKVCESPVPATKRYCSDACKKSAPTIVDSVCACGSQKCYRSSKCKSCRDYDYGKTTLGELRSKAKRDAQVYNVLRGRSRRIASKTMTLECLVCSWDAHVEVCHIRALSDLPDETTVDEATSASNFVLLCPNHHWQLDHQGLDLAPHLGVEPS